MVSEYDKLDSIGKFAVLDYIEEKRLSSKTDPLWSPKWDELKETVSANHELVAYLSAAVMRGERRSIGGRRSFSPPLH